MVKEKSSHKKHDYELYAQIAVVIILTGILFVSIIPGNISASIIPAGVPSVYGEELGVTYDDVSPYDQRKANSVINLLGNIDRTETLDETQMQRYTDILYNMNYGISCEYCCGARSIIFENGQPACGCAHSYAMRGLTKYLIKYHGDEFTNEEIFEEIGKWKVLFFPEILEGKAEVMESQGLDVDYISLTSNIYRGIERGQLSGNGGMIGSC